MPTSTLQNVFDLVRANLSDTQVAGGEWATNAFLVPLFAEPYRSMYSRLAGGSKRIQLVSYITLPAYTSVAIPSTFGMTNFSEPEMIEERPAPTSIAIASTDTSTPINVTTSAPHGLSSNTLGAISGVSGSFAPWGRWYPTVTGPSTFSLNGSGSDGNAGTGGAFYPDNVQQFVEVTPIDLTGAGIDGPPQSTLGSYLWANEQLQFRGASSAIQLRITYYSSGAPPTSPSATIGIDNAIDFLAAATTANAARAKNWLTMYRTYRDQAYGDPMHPDEPSLLDLFYLSQVMASQRGPQRRQAPFRDKRYKYGTYVLG